MRTLRKYLRKYYLLLNNKGHTFNLNINTQELLTAVSKYEKN